MVVLPLSKLPTEVDTSPKVPNAPQDDQVNWLRIVSAATLVTGGALFLAGKPRIALAAAAAGTSMALFDQQETVKKVWALLPDYIAEVQRVLTQVQETVDEVAAQRDKLGRVLGYSQKS